MADETWRAEAKCRDMPTHIFFPERGEPLGPAKQVCDGCPARTPCLEFALGLSGAMDRGIWGGTGERDRKRIRANRTRARRFDGRAAG